jgi:ribonuclease HI
VKGTQAFGLTFKKEKDLSVKCFVDSDHLGDPDTLKSTSGYVFLMNGVAVSWASKLQRDVSLSSMEAEYYAICNAAKELVWLSSLLSELRLMIAQPIEVLSDSQSAEKFCKNPVYHERSKHIRAKWYFVRDMLKAGDFSLNYVPSSKQVADVLTKPLVGLGFRYCRSHMGLSEIALSAA